MAHINGQDWNWPAADREWQRAVELNPISLDVCQCYAIFLAENDRFPEAFSLMDRAVSLNPLSAEVQASYGEILLYARDYTNARPHLQRALELDPNNYDALRVMSNIHEMTGDLLAALDFMKRAAVLRYGDPEKSPQLGRIYAKLGRRADALRILSNVTQKIDPYQKKLETLYFALGDKDGGFKTLTRLFDQHADAQMTKIDPLLDDVRDDPRMQALIARLNLP
jgi:tetratricopeptide (TPR) repeat protein